MKILLHPAGTRLHRAAFTLVEVMVAMAIIGILFVSLYAGFLSGFQIIRLSRENLRATQIMVEKMETIRLYTWEQVNSNGFIPTNFVASYYPGITNGGFTYHGNLAITAGPTDTTYGTNMRSVTITLRWTNNPSVQHIRSMSTYISRYGMQNYIY